MADLFHCLIDCGFRISEMLGCGKKDEILGCLISSFSLEHNTITSFINKTKEVRTLPLSDRMREILERRGEIPFENLNYDGAHAIWYGAVASAGQPARIGMQGALNLGRDGVIHVTRHTYASDLMAAGCSLVILQHALGHAKIQTTMKYAHFDVKMLLMTAAIIDKINESTEVA